MREDEQERDTLKREKEALSQQVKMLIKAEGKLYEYQEELDAQLKEYKELYDFNRRLNGLFNVADIFQQTVAYVIEHLDYERAVCLRREDDSGSYRVCALDGYYAATERDAVKSLIIPFDASCLSPLFKGSEYLLCSADCHDEQLLMLGAKLLMREFMVYPLGSGTFPRALLAIGNSAENAVFYRRVDESRGSLLSLGNIVGLVSSVIENRIFYEELEKARAQERVAEAKYRSIFENAVEGMFQRTPEGRYLDANRSLARTLGYASAGELISQVTSIAEQIWVEPQRHDELIRLLQANGAVEGFEARMYRKDRSVIWASLSMRIVRGSGGEVLHYEGTLEEVTQRKMAEEALRESERKYRQLSEDLEQRVREAVDELRQKDKILILQGRQAVMGEMISNIAHQWRQPLNMLALLVQDLQITQKKEGLTTEYVESSVKRSLEIISQMSKTIDYFRYFFKPDTEKVEFRILETIQKTVAMLEGSLRTHDIRTEVEACADPQVSGYPTEFVQVLLNLLLNARDALIARRPENPLISIRLCMEGETTVLTVADNAGGVPVEIIERIFDPYFTTKGPEQGTGIGLFMCKTIIEKNMGGRLGVRNTGNGAEFRIEIKGVKQT